MKKKIILILILLPFISLGQKQLEHEKKMFTDENGRIYINKALPIYLKVSSSSEQNSEKHLMESKSHPENSNPIYFANEGLNYFYSPWAVDTITKQVVEPKQYVKFQIYADSKPPKTKIKNNTTAYAKSDTLFFGKNLKINFKTTDNVSGVSKTYYSVDGEDFKEYSTDITFDQEKSYIIKFYSVDNVGNAEEIQTVEFTIDSSKPLTNLYIIGDHVDNIISGKASISLKPQDAFSGAANTFYILDNNEKSIYKQPISASKISEGKHTLKYFTEDEVQNREDEKTFTFYVDKSAPLIIDEIIGDVFFANGKEYTSGRTQLQLTAIDNRAGVKSVYYSVGGEEFKLYEKPFYLPQKQGEIKIDYYAIDNVNNKTNANGANSIRNKFFSSYIDLTSPDLDYQIVGEKITFDNTLYISPSTKIKFIAKDTESGIQKITYSLDQGGENEYDTEITVAENGEHSLAFFAYDNVNNSEQKNLEFIVDGTAPQIFTQFSLNSIAKKTIDGVEYDVYPKHFILYLSAIDDMVGVANIFYSINGNLEKAYTKPISKLPANQLYNLEIKALDFLGNFKIFQTKFYIKD